MNHKETLREVPLCKRCREKLDALPKSPIITPETAFGDRIALFAAIPIVPATSAKPCLNCRLVRQSKAECNGLMFSVERPTPGPEATS